MGPEVISWIFRNFRSIAQSENGPGSRGCLRTFSISCKSNYKSALVKSRTKTSERARRSPPPQDQKLKVQSFRARKTHLLKENPMANKRVTMEAQAKAAQIKLFNQKRKLNQTYKKAR